MRLSHVRWGVVAGLAAVSEVLLVAVTIVYMIIYGNLNPGHAQDYYERHVRVAGPWISITAGLPIFFVFARWLAKRARPGMAMVSAVALWAVWALLDTTILLAAGGVGGIGRILPLWLASYASKLASAWAGVRLGWR